MKRRIVVASMLLCAGAGGWSMTSAQFPPVPVPEENPITEEKRVLGKILFWAERLALE